MALLKLSRGNSNEKNMQSISYHCDLPRSLNDDTIADFCMVDGANGEAPTTAVSVKIIHHFLGSDHDTYPVTELLQSFECYWVLCKHLVRKLQNSKDDIKFFQDRNLVHHNIMIAVLCDKTPGKRPHLRLFALIRMTIDTEPKVRYCKLYDLLGKCFWIIYKQLNTVITKYLVKYIDNILVYISE